MRPANKLATYEDLMGLSDDIRAEIVAGEIVALPSPLPEHVRVQRSVGSFIGGPFDDEDGRGGPGGWWILPEVDVELERHGVVRPDVSGWRRERLPSPWGVRPLTVRPDWICEILSPSNEAHDRITKARMYAGHGVPYYWIIDPEERMLEALVLHGERWLVGGRYDEKAVAAIAPFDALELDVGRLFPPRPAST